LTAIKPRVSTIFLPFGQERRLASILIPLAFVKTACTACAGNLPRAYVLIFHVLFIEAVFSSLGKKRQGVFFPPSGRGLIMSGLVQSLTFFLSVCFFYFLLFYFLFFWE
jgi:hypothetical protein